MKKLCILFFLIAGTWGLTAQTVYTTSQASDRLGFYVIYQDDVGNVLSLVHIDGGYLVRYWNKKTKKNSVAFIDIKKDFFTGFTYLDTAPDIGNAYTDYVEPLLVTKEEYLNLIEPKLEDLFSYTDMGVRQQMPIGLLISKTDLNGKLVSEGYVDFYIPITYLHSVKDTRGKTILTCIRFGAIQSYDELPYFFQFNEAFQPNLRPMKKADTKKWQKVTINNMEMDLPESWQYINMPDLQACVYSQTTQSDSVIFARHTSLAANQCKDVATYIWFFMYNVYKQAAIVPDSVEVKQMGEALWISFDIIDSKYTELNTIILAFFQDGDTVDYLEITGYADFVAKNKSMYEKIVTSARVK